MEIKYSGLSDIGRKREKNEDSFLISEKLKLAVVADGMGGHQGGARASKIAVDTISEVMNDLCHDPDSTIKEGFSIDQDDIGSYIRYAIQVANKRIFDESTFNGELRGMGTTVVSLILNKNKLYIAHVGDSRAYKINQKEIKQMTRDHSLVEEQVQAGIISAKDAKEHRFKNIITRSVGFEEAVDVDVNDFKPKKGDKYLICSDGLSNMLDDKEIFEIVKNNTIENASKRLIDLANERGGDDNITVIIGEIITEKDDDEKEESTHFLD